MKKILLVCSSLALTSAVPGVLAQQSGEVEVKTLVQRFFAAEKAYDANLLEALIDPAYVEISPAGELDAHDRFLGFYTPDKKIDWPPMSVSEEQVRVFGDIAVDTLKTSYAMPDGKGGTRELAIRGSFVAQRQGSTWKLLSAQYTGVRPAAAPPQGK